MRRASAACLTIVGATVFPMGHNAVGQVPFFVKDTYTVPVNGVAGSSAIPIGQVPAGFLFFASDTTNGGEFWRTDGTEAGTHFIRDIRPGKDSSTNPISNTYPYALRCAILNGAVLFGANDGSNGAQLWRSNGTTAGTYMLKRLRAHPDAAAIQSMIPLAGRIAFDGSSLTTNIPDLWFSDGTEAGTTPIGLIELFGASNPTDMVAFGNAVVFVAGTPSNSGLKTLWISDGTPAGTVQLTSATTGSNIIEQPPVVFQSKIFFTRRVSGPEQFWVSDGTPAGTHLFTTAIPSPAYFTVTPSTMFFIDDDGVHGEELWKTDGTPAGTALAVDFNSTHYSSLPLPMAVIGNRVLVSALDAVGQRKLYITDGTPAGTIPLVNVPLDFRGERARVIDGVAYFDLNDGVHGRELWRSDGTVAGTRLVRDITPGPEGSFPGLFVPGLGPNGPQLYFNATDAASGSELWATDGTTAGTAQVLDLNREETVSGGIRSFTDSQGSLFFTSGFEIWKSDGTPIGTAVFQDTDDGIGPPSWLTPVGSDLFYSAAVGGRNDLWKTDGPAAGTVRLASLADGPFVPSSIAAFGSGVLFRGFIPGGGEELFISNGTVSGTAAVKDIWPGFNGSGPSDFFQFGARALFCARDESMGLEPWITDGTAAGTTRLSDIWPGSGSSLINNSRPTFTEFSGAVYFIANNGTNGEELWKTDGTSGGTSLVVDLRPGSSGSGVRSLTVHNGWLYFIAYDGVGSGYGLFRTDGTASGTSAVRRFSTPGDFDELLGLRSAADALYFIRRLSLTDTTLELWKSDGTESGTVLVMPLAPGKSFWMDQLMELRVIDGRVYFPAYTPQTGVELWTTDGTPAGTHAIEIVPGPSSSLQVAGDFRPTASGQLCYFPASGPGLYGTELWAFVLPDRQFCPADFNEDGFVTGDDFDGFLLAFETGDPAADFNDDGFITGDDFDQFVALFESGC